MAEGKEAAIAFKAFSVVCDILHPPIGKQAFINSIKSTDLHFRVPLIHSDRDEALRYDPCITFQHL